VPYANGIPEQIISSLVWNGQRGVQIFFAVSGFLITSTTPRRWGMLKAVNVRAFCQMRFARIAPYAGGAADDTDLPGPKTGGKLQIALLAGFVVMGPLATAWLAHGNEVRREYS